MLKLKQEKIDAQKKLIESEQKRRYAEDTVEKLGRLATEYAKKDAKYRKKYKKDRFRRKVSSTNLDEQEHFSRHQARDNSIERKQKEEDTAIQQANEKASARNVFNIVASLIFAVTLGSFVIRMNETDDFGADASVYHLQFVIYVLSLLFWGFIKFFEGFRRLLSCCLCRKVTNDNSWKYNRVRSALFNVIGIICSWTLKFTSTHFTTVNGSSWAIAAFTLQVFLFMASIYDWILPCCYAYCCDSCKREWCKASTAIVVDKSVVTHTSQNAADMTKQQSTESSSNLSFGSESEPKLSGYNQSKKIYDDYKKAKEDEQEASVRVAGGDDTVIQMYTSVGSDGRNSDSDKGGSKDHKDQHVP